ncbi:MAG: hypothetical protein JWR35_222 [Marmoricola sp.]|nr:hypothetical protein [Marmoricola sp.]
MTQGGAHMQQTFKSLAGIIVVLTIGAFMLAAPAQADYPSQSETSCTVDVSVATQGGSVVATFEVASGVGTPSGDAIIQFKGHPPTRVPLVNGVARVPEPDVKPGEGWTVTASYAPTAGSAFKSSQCSASLDPTAGGGGTSVSPPEVGGGGGGTSVSAPELGGILPNTGGPSLYLFALAVLMLATGLMFIQVGRRRPVLSTVATVRRHR